MKEKLLIEVTKFLLQRWIENNRDSGWYMYAMQLSGRLDYYDE